MAATHMLCFSVHQPKSIEDCFVHANVQLKFAEWSQFYSIIILASEGGLNEQAMHSEI